MDEKREHMKNRIKLDTLKFQKCTINRLRYPGGAKTFNYLQGFIEARQKQIQHQNNQKY